ncbi:DELLA protein RGL1-like [Juglans microcarpa x Juglans regia]|uniref:DELLA protein RGL1-like n=1 Tax=Juglans microcarpa x Juglans regia TaxID=2249226 RepID=UPI001B7EA4C2|nr:DELLA protein RGL1-like [Juglans microcarpa x Juglans regia]
MDNTFFFSSTPFGFDGIQGSFGSLEGFEKAKQDHFFNFESGEGSPISTRYGFHHGDRGNRGTHFLKDQLQHQQPKSGYQTFDEFHFNLVFPPTKTIRESTGLVHLPTRVTEILENDNQFPHPSSLAFLELLQDDGSGFQRLQGENSEKLSEISAETCALSRKLSTEEIFRVAGARYVQLSTQMYNYNYHMPMHPFGFALSGLSDDEKKDVELAHDLLSVAEKVGYQQYDRASRLLLRCDWISSSRGSPVQRVVFHFAEALRERIQNESGRVRVTGFEQNNAHLGSNSALLKFYQQLPFPQIALFTGIQAIVENVELKRKVHLIDIEIRSGVHWSLLMQALAERRDFPIELLKITAIGLGSICNESIEKTGKRLAIVAESLNLPFTFKSVLLSDMKDIKEELFEIEDEEEVIIFAPLVLRTMISRPNCIENFMSVIRNLYPSIMVVFEVEANHNSPSFVNRFIEALFFYCAYFDSLETCMKQYDEERMRTEALLGEHIRNLVAEEGRGRTNRNVTMDVWRAFFLRFKMVEIGLSESSLFQASLVVERFSCTNYCTLDKNGKSLLVGWKGTPLHSLSVWKFN